MLIYNVAVIILLQILAPIVGDKHQTGGGTITAITAVTGTGTSLNTFPGDLGVIFTANANMTITHVGRYSVSTSTGSHVVKLVLASAGACTTDVLGAQATVNMSGSTTGTFVYSPIDFTTGLVSGSQYCLVSQESNGGDFWFDTVGTTTTSTADITIDSGGVFNNGGGWNNAAAGAGHQFVPVSFKYTIP